MQELALNRNKKDLIKEIIKEINTTDNKEKKLKLFQSILQIDNTQSEIIIEYLLLVKQIRGLNDNKLNPIVEIFTYINHIPLKEFNTNFLDITKKEYSSIDKLLLFLNNILNQNWIKATFNERKKFINFLNTLIKEELQNVKNTNIITWENSELYIYNLYYELLEQIKKKIVYYESQNDSIGIKNEKIN